MKKIYVMGFEDVTDPVKTEQTIYEQLSCIPEDDFPQYSYVVMPIADLLNKTGVQATQNIIDTICNEHIDEKLIFVCQHIQVNILNFHNNLVFTPHATVLDSYIPIPHFACNYDTTLARPWDEREYQYSFMGDYSTSQTRSHIYEFLKDYPNTIFIDTKQWHFYSDKKIQSINKQNYMELLGNTKYSLCPRGTGPSTIRIWESIAMNSCPLVFSNYLQMPLSLTLKTKLWFILLENCVSINPDYVNTYDNTEYWEKFSNSNLYKSIINVL